MLIELRRKKKNKANWENIAKDYNSGILIRDIMAKYKLSKAGVYYILNKLKDK